VWGALDEVGGSAIGVVVVVVVVVAQEMDAVRMDGRARRTRGLRRVDGVLVVLLVEAVFVY